MNPWESMGEGSRRRVDTNVIYNLFWVLDIGGGYGFCIQSPTIFDDVDKKVTLKGITIIKRNEINHGNLYLILNSKEEWEIFYTLCLDLIEAAKRCNGEELVIGAIEKRLVKWQRMLKDDSYKNFTIEKQMGLFAELICLKNIIAPEMGIKQAINSWVGPDFDKQDFLIDDAVIEVKAYRTTKGERVQISSLQQLESPKDPIYLIANGLTNTENGLSVRDMADSIINMLAEDEETIELFDQKLNDYGYISRFIEKQHLYGFILDDQKVYKVTDLFPKIVRGDIKPQILDVKYTIDLSQCREFKVSQDELFKEGSVI
jgi:hypothetical protein